MARPGVIWPSELPVPCSTSTELRSSSDLVLHFVSDLQVLSPEKEPLCWQQRGLCACGSPGAAVHLEFVDYGTAWHKIQGIECSSMALQHNAPV